MSTHTSRVRGVHADVDGYKYAKSYTLPDGTVLYSAEFRAQNASKRSVAYILQDSVQCCFLGEKLMARYCRTSYYWNPEDALTHRSWILGKGPASPPHQDPLLLFINRRGSRLKQATSIEEIKTDFSKVRVQTSS